MTAICVIGAGMGGLAAAIDLAQRGYEVTLLEARATVGGLAAGFEQDGLPFDAGPYILLDREGLQWAFERLGVDLDAGVALHRLGHVYSVALGDEPPLEFHTDLERTAEGFELRWPGSGRLYREFVAHTALIHSKTRPMLVEPKPTLGGLIATGALRHVRFLLRSLQSVLRSSGLPEPVQHAMAIWTHVAGQEAATAPSPLAFVPALIHTVGAYYPEGGIGGLASLLAARAVVTGVTLRLGTKVRRIDANEGRVTGVTLTTGERLAADAVVAAGHGVGTYLSLLDLRPGSFRERVEALPLQSPGACAYLAVDGPAPPPPYLRFWIPDHLGDTPRPPGGSRELCRLFIAPPVADPTLRGRSPWPARLLSPMRHDEVERMGEDGPREHLERLLGEPWWRPFAPGARVVATRTPAEWGRAYSLHRDSMNPVMTAAFMRQGRLAHKSPVVRGLYLAGSATHPGQWVSFAAISGVLAAAEVARDLA